jgi:acetyl esterase/lipase
MNLYLNCYVPPSIDRTQPLVSPIFATPSSFPSSVTILSGGADILTAEAHAFANKLAGERDVVYFEAPGQGHAWDKVAWHGTEGGKLKDEAYAIVVERLGKVLLN